MKTSPTRSQARRLLQRSSTPRPVPPATHQAAASRRRGRAVGVVALVLGPLVLATHPASAQTAPKPTPTLITTASPMVPVGGQIFANANLLGVSNPTGTLTFRLYEPGDTTCTSSIFTSVVAVTGTSVNSGRFTTSLAGTYKWTSSYSGDATFSAAGPTPCSGGSESVVVERARVILSLQAEAPSGGTIRDSVTVSGGFNPTGTLTFALYPPADTFCSAPPVFTSTVAVNGTGTYRSEAYRPVTSGTYRWRVTYSGDTNNRGVSWTGCFEPTQAVDVTVGGGTVRGGTDGDYDGDGKADYAVYRPTTGMWYFDRSSTADTPQYWGMVGDVSVPGDYDGDGKADYAVYRPTTGMWYVQTSTGAVRSQYWGMQGDVPVPGDYDGDGKADYAVFRPLSSTWYVITAVGAVRTKYLGMVGDVPVPGDYDGDGKADYAVFRPLTGTWYVITAVGAVRSQYWGMVGDVPVPGDYDGDGKADYAVFRPLTGTWYVITAVGAVRTQYWGMQGDVPVPADYDGDGKADFAVFRPLSGAWYSHLTTGRNVVVGLGAVGDRPVALLHAIWSTFFGAAR